MMEAITSKVVIKEVDEAGERDKRAGREGFIPLVAEAGRSKVWRRAAQGTTERDRPRPGRPEQAQR